MNTIQKSVVLIDPYSSGHHETYLRVIYGILRREFYCHVFVLNARPFEFTQQLKEDGWFDVEGKIHLCPEVEKPSNLKLSYILARRRTLKKFEEYAKKIAGLKAVLFFAWLDDLLVPDFLMPSLRLKWTGILFHPMILRCSHVKIKKMFFAGYRNFRSNRCLKVALLDEGVIPAMEKKCGQGKITFFPDITSEAKPDSGNPIAKDIKDSAGTRGIIACIGCLAKYKGVLSFCEIAEAYNYGDCLFVLAGKICWDTFSIPEQEYIRKCTMSGLGGKLKVYCSESNIVEGGPFNAIVEACDILYVNYLNFRHSSNIMTKATMLSKLLLGSSEFLIGERIIKYKLGSTLSPNMTIKECCTVLQLLIQRYKIIQKEALFTEYFKLHSQSRLSETLSFLCNQ